MCKSLPPGGASVLGSHRKCRQVSVEINNTSTLSIQLYHMAFGNCLLEYSKHDKNKKILYILLFQSLFYEFKIFSAVSMRADFDSERADLSGE